MPAQPEGREADEDARRHPDRHPDRDADPRRDAEMDEQQHHGVGAQPEERRVAEGDEAAVAAQHVPGEPHHRPDGDEREEQRVVRVLHEQGEDEVERGEGRDDEHRLPAPAQVGKH